MKQTKGLDELAGICGDGDDETDDSRLTVA
jgi:hypothetical protein